MVPRRSSKAHKGTNGHLLVVAGSKGMSGAAVLTTLGALRGGAGLVTTATPAREVIPVLRRVPETLTLTLPTLHNSFAVLKRYAGAHKLSAAALGPGLSTTRAARALVVRVLSQWHFPIVLDADAINVLQPNDLKRHASLILTPHPGEMARFLKMTSRAVLRNPAALAEKTARELGIVCVLKGHETVVSNGRMTYVNHTGNSAMATGGMGDVLTGLIGALLAQGLPPLDAAAAGVHLHGLAGDLSKVADRGLLAHELAAAIPLAFRKIQAGRKSR